MQARDATSEAGSAGLPVSGLLKKRVLFVDDEASILEGLRGVLRSQRHEWDMVFAHGGPAGLAAVEAARFDAVVTDMRMPIMDGSALLRRVKDLQPHAVRLVLSGQTDAEAAMRTVFIAHQFLAKPCEPEKLRDVVRRACALNDLVSAPELRALAGGVSLLPPAPRTFLALSGALADPRSSASDVARIVERDPALCAKLLQLVNSAFFGLPRLVTSIGQAASFLGTLALRNLALAIESMASARGLSTVEASAFDDFQRSSLLGALLARQCCSSDKQKADAAFVAGMLRGMGHLVLAARDGHDQPEARHAAVGAFLLGLWGLPHPIMEAVAYYEEPSRVVHDGFELMDVVHVADFLAAEVCPAPFRSRDARLDLDHLQQRGVTPAQIERLRYFAPELLSQVKEMLA